MQSIYILIFTFLYIALVGVLVYFILKDTDFLKSGFRYKNIIVWLCMISFCCSCNKPIDKNWNDAPVKALMDYHYGVKYQDTNRFKQAIFDYHPKHIDVAMFIFQTDTDCDIVWEYDSFIGKKKDSVWVYYREINSVWGDMLHRKLFVRYKGRWARKIGYD